MAPRKEKKGKKVKNGIHEIHKKEAFTKIYPIKFSFCTVQYFFLPVYVILSAILSTLWLGPLLTPFFLVLSNT